MTQPSGQTQRAEWYWPYWPLVPIYPYGQRRTLRTEVIPGQVWTFDQVQGIFYVVVPIRMTVVKLAAGGLLVYAPVAPTPECLRLLQELIDQHGTVQHIILPTISGVEHKVFVAPFARKFPVAQVWVTPGQWSFPLDLPLTWLGLPRSRTQILPANPQQTPLTDEFDYAILGPLKLGLGKFGEVAFFHRRSRTLLLTDTVLSVPEKPPQVLEIDPYPLLFHAKDEAWEQIIDIPEHRQKGWQRICLFALYFRPSTLDTIDLPVAWQAAKMSPDRSRSAYFGLYPFKWESNWLDSFQNLCQAGALQVAPILQTLILNREPQTVANWVHQLVQWDFQQIIPCHFSAPIVAQAEALQAAFQFLREPGRDRNPLTTLDLQVLRDIDARLVELNVTPPAKLDS